MGLFNRIDTELRDRWTDVFKADAGIHMLVMVSIVAGVFQGWLKDRMGGPIPYVLSDGCLMGAIALWFGTAAMRGNLLGGTRKIGGIVLVLILVPTAYFLVPGTPVIIKMAGLRTWVIFPLACLVALSVIKSTGQLRAYLGLVILLATITGAYGIYQYQVGPEAALQAPLGLERHSFTVFYADVTGGQSGFRAFSTFTFPGTFAGFMVLGFMFATGVALSHEYRKWTRIGVALLIPLFFIAITVSGTRAAFINVVLALGIVGWLRGFTAVQLAFIPIGMFAAHIATAITAGQFVPRLASVFLEEGAAWSRVLAPITIAGRTLDTDPLGIGLGRSGVGVPFRIFQSMPQNFFRGGDGDLARVAVELGLVGIALLLVVAIGVIPLVTAASRRLVRTDSDDAAMGIGPIVLSTTVLLLIGSPLTSTPQGIVWWFAAGAILKLDAITQATPVFDSGEQAAFEPPEEEPEVVPIRRHWRGG
jgi:hypothetical protein